MTRDQHDHVKRKDINKAKKRLSRLNTNRRIALYRLLGQNQEEILDLVRISNLAGAEGFEPSARGFGVDVEKALTDIQQPVFRAPYFKGSHQVFQHLRLAGQLFASCGAALGVIRVAVHHA